jgi:hypothetical protein
MTNGSPTGIIRVSNRCSRFESRYRSHGVKSTVIPSEWSSASPIPARSSKTHHSTFGVLVGSRDTIAI